MSTGIMDNEAALDAEPQANEYGVLYLSATPIGNLEDMTERAVRMLREADLVAAEDTRHTRKLLTHFDIHTPLTSYHEHNKFEKGPQLIKRLLDGENIVCVSDAGLPGISDPGSHLAQLAIEAGIRVSPIPGANAALSALICSGLDTTMFTFVGFLPKTGKKSRELLAEISKRKETLIFYEAPHHLKKTLKELTEALGENRRASVARELTKRFEEFKRATLGELSAWYDTHEPRGEFVIVVSGAEESEESPEEDRNLSPVELVHQYESSGMPRKEAMREAAKQLGMSRRDVYRMLLESEENN